MFDLKNSDKISKGISMKAAESMQTLYEIVEQLKGSIIAKNFVSDSIFNIISELHEEKKTVTAEAIEERLAKLTQDFIEATKNKNDVA